MSLTSLEVFEFPLREEEFGAIKSTQHLKELLTSEALHLRIVQQYFRVSMQKNMYIYARCRACNAKLWYKLEDGIFKLNSYRNTHRHSLKRRTTEIESFIRSMPATLSTQSLMQITRNAFRITPSKFYYHNKKLWSEKVSFKEIADEFDLLKYETRYLPFPLQEG